jgi:hypothetical protein
MKIFRALLAGALLASVGTAQDAPPAAPEPAELSAADRLEALDEAQLQSAIDALRQRHLEASTLDETAIRRATLRGLLSALAPGAELAGESEPPAPDSAFRSEVLDERTGYLRLGTLGTPLDGGGMGLFNLGYRAGFLVGLLRIGLGRLVVLGPGGERLSHALVGGHGADPFAHGQRQARQLQGLDGVVVDQRVFAVAVGHIFGPLGGAHLGSRVRV